MENDDTDFTQKLKECGLHCIHCCATCGHHMNKATGGVVDCLELHLKNLPWLFQCDKWKYGMGIEFDDLKEDDDLKVLSDAISNGSIEFPCPKCRNRVYDMQRPSKDGFEAWGCSVGRGVNCIKDFVGKPKCDKFAEGGSTMMWC